MDSTINRAHQHASGARRGEEVAIGRSKGGLTTKVHMLADAHGNPLQFILTEGQAHDMKEASTLAQATTADIILGDKGYDSEPLREELLQKAVVPVIPRRENSKKPNPSFDRELYKARHTIENLFAKMKQFRGFATRFDKLKRNYAAVVAIVCSAIWFRLFAN
jgi:transposase